MTLRFIHTADWHIGKIFSAFDAERAAVLRDARERAIEAIAAAARSNGTANVLVAGDIFDSQDLPDSMLRRLMSLLAAADDINWYLLPGNHDADRAAGVWARLTSFGFPANVIALRERNPLSLASGAVLLPAPLYARHTAEDPTVWFNDALKPAGNIIIGLAHGSVQSFGGDSEAGVTIMSERARHAGLDYLALGDWHSYRQVNAKTWYSGAPEATGFAGHQAGFVLSVVINGPGSAPQVEPVHIGQFGWHRLEIEADGGDVSSLVRQALAALPQMRARMLVRLIIKGVVRIRDYSAMLQIIEDQAPSFFDLKMRETNMHLTAAQDPGDIFTAPELQDLAIRLSKNTDTQNSAVERHALQLLSRFALRANGKSI